MFLQPMLIIEELEQVPYSLCKTAGKQINPEVWHTYLADLSELLQADTPSNNERLQQRITWARTVNGQAGWIAVHGLTDYQNIAREVQSPTDWHNLSREDRESLDGYIELRLTGPTDSEMAVKPNSSSLHVGIATGPHRHHLSVSTEAAKPLFAQTMQAFGRIKKRELLDKIMGATRTQLEVNAPFMSPYEARCTACKAPQADSELQRCARCKVPRYCGVACQRADWKESHKAVCDKFTATVSIKAPSSLVEALNKRRTETLKFLGRA